MTPLEARVKAANSCREVASKLYEPLAKVFTDLIGKKICKTDGTLLPEFPIYSVENVIAARERLKLAKKALVEAEAEVYPFGEYDR